MAASVFHPWLFDNKAAWTKTISDSRWSYDLPMSRFMALYAENRGSAPIGFAQPSPPPLMSMTPIRSTSASPMSMASPTVEKADSSSSSKAGQILSQNEIDSLLTSLSK